MGVLRDRSRDALLVQKLDLAGVQAVIDSADRAMLAYSEKLTLEPSTIGQADVDVLREAGFTDPEIGDIALTVAFFSYMNRIADGLGTHISKGIEADARRLGVWDETLT